MTTLSDPTTTRPGSLEIADDALDRHVEETAARLLDSAGQLSYDPLTEIDWDAPLDPALYGLNPEWSSLYGTPLWTEMTQQQRVTLTRHEVASIMSTGIWFEMILQQMVLRDQYAADKGTAEFRFALTEVADECRHSDMFSRACTKLDASGYFPRRPALELGRFFKTVATGDKAYAAILVAEEVLDVMQRDWMRGADVLPMIRTSSKIHVVEESRHMAFARQEIRDSLVGVNGARRALHGVVIAVVADIIVSNLVHPGVYAAAGLDVERAVAAATGNEHHRALLRTSCRHLMDFLGEVGLLPRAAVRVYQHAGLA